MSHQHCGLDSVILLQCNVYENNENHSVEPAVLAGHSEEEASQATQLTRGSYSLMVRASNQSYGGCGFDSYLEL